MTCNKLFILLNIVFLTPNLANGLPKETRRVSTNTDNADATGPSLLPTISGNGRLIIYTSEADNLIYGPPEIGKFMVYDITNGLNQILFKGYTGAVPDGLYNEVASVSFSARYVLISTQGNNVDTSDSDSAVDAYLIDRISGTRQLVSQTTTGTQVTSPCYGLDLTDSGRFVLFSCDGDGIIPEDTNNRRDVFLLDRNLNQISWVSAFPGISRDDCNAGSLSLSKNGKFTLFSCSVSGSSNSNIKLFRYNRITGVTIPISINSDGTTSNGVVARHGITEDGRKAIFSFDKSMTPSDNDLLTNIYLRDIAAKKTNLLVTGIGGQLPDQDTIFRSLTPDGRYITFASNASNLDNLADTGYSDIYRFDSVTKKSLRLSINNFGTPGNGNGSWSVISNSGRRIAFSSSANNLHLNDSDNDSDVFVRILK